MRITSKSSKIVSLSIVVIIVGALLYFGFRGASLRPVIAAPQQTQPATRTVSTTVRDSYADIVDRVAPAVVTIRSARRVRAPQQFPFFDDPFFQRFFGGRSGSRPRQDRALVEHALGSGVIVSADGYI